MKLKKIISNIELQEQLKKAIHLLCDTVKTTLGPIGTNTIIDHSTFSPFITNDGVTIAKNIESEDSVINTILELAKEAAIKTDETVGDGTTTTLVLLEEIFLEGLQYINKGKKAIQLKQELLDALEKIIPMIIKKSKKPTKTDLKKIASISANDKEIGAIICETYSKMKNKHAIRLVDGKSNNTEIHIYKGYQFDTQLASLYFLKAQNLKFGQSHLLLTTKELNYIEEIAPILNHCIEKKKNLFIIANNYSEEFVNTTLSFYLDNKIPIVLFKNPEFGDHQFAFLNDLSILANCQILENLELVQFNHLGKIEGIEITKDKTTISFKNNPKIQKHIMNLKNTIKQNSNEFDEDFYHKRIAMFTNGLAEIIIGGHTETEIREKHMRMTDALSAIETAKKGIVPGGGLIFLELSQTIPINTDGEKIIQKALQKPFIQILENAGIQYEPILKQIKKNNYQKIFNIIENVYQDIENTSVLDPTEVITNSLINATSIASMLLTTTNLVINEYQNELNKQNEFNDL